MKKIFLIFLLLLIFSCSYINSYEEKDIDVKYSISKSELIKTSFVFSTDKSIRIYFEGDNDIKILNEECKINNETCIIGLAPYSLSYDIDFKNGHAIFFVYEKDRKNLKFPINLSFKLKKNEKFEVLNIIIEEK